jgi:hypothetical protein
MSEQIDLDLLLVKDKYEKIYSSRDLLLAIYTLKNIFIT